MRYRPIRRNGEFGRVYARGKSYVNQALVLYVLKTRSKRTRVGLTATKKIGHAVQRSLPRPACRIRQSSRAQSPQPPCLRSGSPRREHLSESPLRAHPALPEVHQPGAGAELPLFALLQPVRHRGHPHPRLRQRAAADGVAHRPVQSAGPLGLRPRTGKGPLEKSGPASLGLGSVFHQTRKISGKLLRRCSLEER